MAHWTDTYTTEAVFNGKVRHVVVDFGALCGYYAVTGWWGARKQVDTLPLCKKCKERAEKRKWQLEEILEGGVK